MSDESEALLILLICLKSSELFRDPENIIPTQMMIGSTTYADINLVPPNGYGSPVATNLTAFQMSIQEDWPDDNVNALRNAYNPVNYGGSLMNAQVSVSWNV